MSKSEVMESTYFRSLMEGTGCTSYKFSDTPVEMSQQKFIALNRTVKAMLDVIDTSEYFDYCKERNYWSLPTVPMKLTDFHGCADFLLTSDEPKLIEMNINIPGRVALMETMGRSAKQYLDASSGIWTNLNFNEQVKLEIQSALAESKKIAIVVSHFEASIEHWPHYQYFSDQLNQEGLDTTVMHANEITADENGCFWNGQFYDGIVNLVIPFVWENNQHEFTELTKLLRDHPERIFPSPTGGMLGTKDLLSYLSSKRDNDKEGVWKNNVLRAKPLSSFESIEELLAYLTPEQMVLKPFKDYGGSGVYVQPELELVEETFSKKRNEYMVQEFTDSLPKQIHTDTDEMVTCHSTICRVFFASKNPFGYKGSYVTGDARCGLHAAPVKITRA
ncbi:MAG: glutathionylspermidine synthase family protein [Crocinitomicaceae bacterium]